MPRILVIDDEARVRNMLGQALERAGYEVVAAGDGAEGMAQYRDAPVDLIITDIIMPEKEGIETIVEMRREFPDVKIIAISGGGKGHPDSYLQMARKLGADWTFAKPLIRHELLAAIRELLEE